ncbi:hypothetical protein Pcinc_025969, partial [Petrolisthes cinctipes]
AVSWCFRGEGDHSWPGAPPSSSQPPRPSIPAWPGWRHVKESLREDIGQFKGSSLLASCPHLPHGSLDHIRSSVGEFGERLHERVSWWGEQLPCPLPWQHQQGSTSNSNSRSRSRSRTGRTMKRGGKMRRGEWYSACFCFKGSEPPQIEHVVSEQPQMVQVAPPPNMTEDLEPEELQTKVTELLDELDLTAVQKTGILNFPPEKQLQLLYDYHTLKSSNKKIESPEAYIAKLDEYSELTVPADQYQHHSWLKYTEGLKTALATQSNTFVGQFMDAGGLASLLRFLESMDDTTFQSSIHMNIIACVKALMNNSNGRRHILAHPSCMNVICQSLRTHNLKTKTVVLEILGGVCLLPGGHKKVLEAMLHFQKFAGERTRFQTLIVDLDRSFGNYGDELSLRIAIMSFINAVIRWGPGEDSLEFRLHLRYEFLMLGVQPVIEKLRDLQNDILDK